MSERRRLPNDPAQLKLDFEELDFEHVYPEGYVGHEDEWVLFEENETSEHLELKPAASFVRVTIRHKGIRKATKDIILSKDYLQSDETTVPIVDNGTSHCLWQKELFILRKP